MLSLDNRKVEPVFFCKVLIELRCDAFLDQQIAAIDPPIVFGQTVPVRLNSWIQLRADISVCKYNINLNRRKHNYYDNLNQSFQICDR